MIDLNITNEELNELKTYMNQNYEAMNQMLVSDSETDIALLSDEVENEKVNILYSREAVIEYLKAIKTIYKIILKKYYSSEPQNENVYLYRGTNLAEVERLKNELFIDRFLVMTEDKKTAENEYSSKWNRPVCMNILLEKDVPFIYLKDVLNIESDAVLVSAFTKIKKITEDEENKLEKNSKVVKNYNIILEKQQLDELTDRERNGLYEYILENSYFIKRKLEECIELEKENSVNFENIRKLEQLLNKYEMSEDIKDDFEENISDPDDVARINKELQELKQKSNTLFDIRKENINFVNIWKRNIAVYMIAECKEIEKQFEEAKAKFEEERIKIAKNNVKVVAVGKIAGGVMNEIVPDVKVVDSIKDVVKATENNDDNLKSARDETKILNPEEVLKQIKEKDEKLEEINVEDGKDTEKEDTDSENEFNNESSKIYLDSEEEIIEDVAFKNLEKELENAKPVMENVIGEMDTLSTSHMCLNSSEENVEMVQKLLKDINLLISKQQNHAKIAGNVGCSYSALNNAFEMRKKAEVLLELVQNINLKVKELSEKKQTKKVEEKLNSIFKNNTEISTLLNYLNNPKIAVRNTTITRFEEMAIIEENELKRKIAEKIREIRGEAELKKLKDDYEIIEDKGTFSRFLGFFTGQNRLDDFMLDQIEIRQNAIRKTLSKKMSLAYNYSIHELMAEINMFINENEDDELIENDVLDLKVIAEELKRNYVILGTKVNSIIEQKEGRNLPVNDRKISKRERIEIDTYRFLNKYGYDIDKTEKEEPQYLDTMSSEINRIIEYIEASNI